MAVSFIASDSVADNTDSHTFASVTTTGSDRHIIALSHQRDNPGEVISSVSRGGDTYTSKAAQLGTPSTIRVHMVIFESSNEPQTASADLTINLNANVSGGVYGYQEFNGVDQTTRSDAETTDNGLSTGPSDITITSTTNDLVVSFLALRDVDVDIAGDQTVDYTTTTASNLQSGAQRAAGAASVGMGWDWTDNDSFAHIAYNLNAAAAGPTVPDDTLAPTVQLMESGGYIGAVIR